MPVASADPVRYLIVCPARTGSSALVSYLRSHPRICSHGEVFGAAVFPVALYGLIPRGAPPLMDWLLEYRTKDPIAFLDLVFYPGTRQAVGCKFKFEELDAPANTTIVEQIVKDTGIQIVFLTRRNLLERYVSQYLAVHVHKRFNVHKGNPLPPSATIRLDPRELQKEFDFTRERQRRFRALFNRHRMFELTYEDLCANTSDLLGRIQEFLGVEPRTLETQLAKLQQQAMCDVIENFEELRLHFQGTPDEMFF